MMAARWKAIAMALALLALHGDFTTRNGVMAEADCLGDGESCTPLESCPVVCCLGVNMRTTSTTRHCPLYSAVFGSSASNTPTAMSSTEDNSHEGGVGSTTDSSSGDNWTPASNAEDTSATDSPSSNSNSTAATTAPTPTPSSTKSSDSVNAFDSSTSSISSSRGDAGGMSTALIVVGALAGCVVMVAAVLYKRKTTNQESLDAPNSAYRGSDDGSGLTPDNRSLVGMLDGGARATTDSMKQLPVLSMGSRDDTTIAPRISSPFGQGTARISSPANRGLTNEDYAFEVETSSRAGSSVQVAFVDVHQDTDVVPEKNGVVAL